MILHDCTASSFTFPVKQTYSFFLDIQLCPQLPSGFYHKGSKSKVLIILTRRCHLAHCTSDLISHRFPLIYFPPVLASCLFLDHAQKTYALGFVRLLFLSSSQIPTELVLSFFKLILKYYLIKEVFSDLSFIT